VDKDSQDAKSTYMLIKHPGKSNRKNDIYMLNPMLFLKEQQKPHFKQYGYRKEKSMDAIIHNMNKIKTRETTYVLFIDFSVLSTACLGRGSFPF
jgi:hypothetical protein